MPTIGIVVSFKHRPGTIRDLQEWLAGQGATMLASTCGPKEHYLGMFMIEGDPTYTLEMRSETTDPDVLDELDLLNSEKLNSRPDGHEADVALPRPERAAPRPLHPLPA